ncbi:MAG TPA: hypothetical protein VGM90_24365 [Kofleriaceae bacterium]|jgi:hypothetical protein
MAYADAARALYQAPLAQFVEERKRLAGELKAAGDKSGATTIAKLPKPPVSAWAVNQLYWQSRAAIDRLFKAADHLRKGDMRANAEHRESLAALRKLATPLLESGGHNANEGTLRRINLTLSAIAAAGTWEPDEPGQLTADRDPPGFDALAALAGIPLPARDEEPEPAPKAEPKPAKSDGSKKAPPDELAERRRKAAEHEAAEKEKAEQKKRDAIAKLKKELASRLDAAQKNVESSERQIAKLSEELSDAEDQLVKARENVEEIESQLASLD